MRKWIAFFCFLFVCILPLSVHAEQVSNDKEWKVWFSSKKKMKYNFTKEEMNQIISTVQPGDDLSFSVSIENQYHDKTKWYMRNDVLSSLEDHSIAKGGAYIYKLVYRNPDGKEKVLYDSQTVGGDVSLEDGSAGLHEATDNLKNYFYLDTLSQKENGILTLQVGLDGETQGNDYQDTLAKLSLDFAVELPKKGKSNTIIQKIIHRIYNPSVVKTGDFGYITLYLCLFLLSVLGIIFSYKKRKR